MSLALIDILNAPRTPEEDWIIRRATSVTLLKEGEQSDRWVQYLLASPAAYREEIGQEPPAGVVGTILDQVVTMRMDRIAFAQELHRILLIPPVEIAEVSREAAAELVRKENPQ